MTLYRLPKITEKKKRRLGRGHGSGRGKTAGRGTKGQKARNSIPLYFEGGALPLIKRLPFLRGKDRHRSLLVDPVVLNVKDLNKLPKNSVVDIDTLVKYKLVKEKEAKVRGVKILGDGELTTPLTVRLPVTKAAEEKILKAGGKVEPISLSVSVSQ